MIYGLFVYDAFNHGNIFFIDIFTAPLKNDEYGKVIRNIGSELANKI